MSLKRTLRYHWLKFRRLQDSPHKLAAGMALGVFIGVTPTVPFHTVAALGLAALLRVSPVTAFLGIQICNPLTIPPFYLAAYKAGRYLFYKGAPLAFPETYTYKAMLLLLWEGGLALQLGGLVLAVPPAVISYFLTLWAVQRYRQRKAPKAASVLALSQDAPPPPGSEA
jgi:hypothetical protein